MVRQRGETQVRLHNDDVHTFDNVTDALLAVGITRPRAFALTAQVDKEGSALVLSGSRAKNLAAMRSLRAAGLIVSLPTAAQLRLEGRLVAAAKWLQGLCVASEAVASLVGELLLETDAAPFLPMANDDGIETTQSLVRVGLFNPPTLVAQAAKIHSELSLEASITTSGGIIAAANERMGIEPVGTLPEQVARLNAAIGIVPAPYEVEGYVQGRYVDDGIRRSRRWRR